MEVTSRGRSFMLVLKTKTLNFFKHMGMLTYCAVKRALALLRPIAG